MLLQIKNQESPGTKMLRPALLALLDFSRVFTVEVSRLLELTIPRGVSARVPLEFGLLRQRVLPLVISDVGDNSKCQIAPLSPPPVPLERGLKRQKTMESTRPLTTRVQLCLPLPA